MFEIFSLFSFFPWFIVFIVIFIKISRLSDRVSELERGGLNINNNFNSNIVNNTATTENISTVPQTSSASASVSVDSLVAKVEEEEKTYTPSVPEISTEEKLGKYLGRLGIGAITLGVAWFLTIVYGNLDASGKFILGLGFGLVMLIAGQMFRKKYGDMADLLMAGGIAVLYLVVFAGNKIFIDPTPLLTSTTSYILMSVVTALAVIISVVNNTAAFALMGTVGGFVTPMLLSTGNNDFTGLCLYMLVLNLGILAVAAFHHWQKVIYTSFVFTAFLFTTSAELYFSVDHKMIIFFFLAIFFFVFLSQQLIHHVLRKEVSNEIDILMMAINAFGFFAWGLKLLPESVHGIWAVGIAFIYVLIAFAMYPRKESDKKLAYSSLSLVVVFLTIAIPLQVSGIWISLAWLIESYVLFVLAFKLDLKGLSLFGGITYLLGLINVFSYVVPRINVTEYLPVFNSRIFILMTAVIVGLGIASLFAKKDATGEESKTFQKIFSVCSALIFLYTFSSETYVIYDQKVYKLIQENNSALEASRNYYGSNNWSYGSQAFVERAKQQSEISDKVTSLENTRNILVNILWVIYGVLLLASGFAIRSRGMRLFGVGLVFITAFKMLIEMWSILPAYRVILFMAFGGLALLGSFAYLKYKDRLTKED